MVSNISRTWRLALVVVLTGMSLMGCTQKTEQPPTESYSALANLQYQADAAQEQIEALELDVEDIKAQGGVVPPGYYAQLSLLYFSLGKAEHMRQRFTAEQDPFSDATAYLNDLMNNATPAEPVEQVDTPNPPAALIETSVEIDFNPEPFSFVRAFPRGNAQHLIF